MNSSQTAFNDEYVGHHDTAELNRLKKAYGAQGVGDPMLNLEDDEVGDMMNELTGFNTLDITRE